MRILTYNLWHGLSPSNPLMFDALEPEARRRLRYGLQPGIISSVHADFVFLQECNPAPERLVEFQTRLGMDGFYQSDMVGIKILGVGFPLNLNSGLITLAQKDHHLRWLSGPRLSGARSFLSSWASFQLKEERYALMCEAMMPGLGRVLLVNTHLHHGLECDPAFMDRVMSAAEELGLSPMQKTELKERLEHGNRRRLQEMGTLLKAIKKWSARYELVVLGGDFNAENQGELGQLLREHGFKDAWLEAPGAGPGLSFDKEDNIANHVLQERFPSTLMVDDLTFSAKTKETLMELMRVQEARPRRIDQIWYRSVQKPIRVSGAELVGRPDADGMAGSDHFGVAVNIEPAD